MSLGMPDYHPYIVLSVMEDIGLLASPKRGLMKFTNRSEFHQRVNTVWSTIVSRVAPDR
jgi:hypothetical protein